MGSLSKSKNSSFLILRYLRVKFLILRYLKVMSFLELVELEEV